MALPKEVKALFDDLPAARARRAAAQEEAHRAQLDAEAQRKAREAAEREALRAELAVAWDWLQTDGRELASELERAGLLRLQLLGPLARDGQPVPWQLDARVLLINDAGLLEVVRCDEHRELRYPVRTLEDFLSVEPPAVLRAFIDAVRTGAIWERVSQQVREVTHPPREV